MKLSRNELLRNAPPLLKIFNFIYLFIYLFNNSQFGEKQLGEKQFGEMPHFFNTLHAFKKIGETQPGEMQFGEMHHTHFIFFFCKKIFIFI